MAVRLKPVSRLKFFTLTCIAMSPSNQTIVQFFFFFLSHWTNAHRLFSEALRSILRAEIRVCCWCLLRGIWMCVCVCVRWDFWRYWDTSSSVIRLIPFPRLATISISTCFCRLHLPISTMCVSTHVCSCSCERDPSYCLSQHLCLYSSPGQQSGPI